MDISTDYLETLISQSCRLETEYEQKKSAGAHPKELASIRAESDALWNKAKELGNNGVTPKNYYNLTNAIIIQAVEDYERMISGTIEANIPKSILGSEETIENFLRNQQITKLNMGEHLDRIKTAYYDEFIPYVEANAESIRKEWNKKSKQHDNVYISQRSKHRCPLCGGTLRPFKKRGYDHVGIGCTGCHLYRTISKWEVVSWH